MLYLYILFIVRSLQLSLNYRRGGIFHVWHHANFPLTETVLDLYQVLKYFFEFWVTWWVLWTFPLCFSFHVNWVLSCFLSTSQSEHSLWEILFNCQLLVHISKHVSVVQIPLLGYIPYPYHLLNVSVLSGDPNHLKVNKSIKELILSLKSCPPLCSSVKISHFHSVATIETEIHMESSFFHISHIKSH
jgi:hypothetical protein